MGRIALLLESEEIVLVSTGDILRAFEIDDPRLKSKQFQTDLLQSRSYKNPTPSVRWKSVNWVDYGSLLSVATDDMRVLILDSSLCPLRLMSVAGESVDSLSLACIEMPPVKNKEAARILEKEILSANKHMVTKRSLLPKSPDPILIAGNLPYNMVVHKIGYSLPWREVRINEYGIVCQHLERGRLETALNIVQNIEDPEHFMQAFVHVANYLMRRTSVLAHRLVINLLIQIHDHALARSEFEYLRNFLNQYYHQLGQRLLTEGKYEEAYRIGLAVESAGLMRNVELYCKWKGRLVMAEAAKKEAMKYDQNITTLAQEMTKISDYTHKALTGEDIQNVINDYHTLMNVTSIHELDLDEFNSWEINLKDYEKALQLELDGAYDEAKTIYEKNKLSADAKRAETLGNLTKAMNQNVVQFVDVSEVAQKEKKQ